MGQIKFGMSATKMANAEAERYDTYTGPRPPKGVYRLSMRRLVMKKNSKQDYMMNCLLAIDEPEGSARAKYNGYVIWWNGNVSEKGAPYINQFLDSLSKGRRAVRQQFWGDKVRVADGTLPQPILAIGPMRINKDGMPCMAEIKVGEKAPGAGADDEAAMRIAQFLTPRGDDSAEDEDVEPESDVSEDEFEIDPDKDELNNYVESDEDGESNGDEDEDGEPPF